MLGSRLTSASPTTINISAILLNGDLNENINLYNETTLLTSGTTPISTIKSFNYTGTFNFTARYPETENYTSDEETWDLTVKDLPITSNVTGGATSCRYKSFGYYNENLPFMVEANCV